MNVNLQVLAAHHLTASCTGDKLNTELPREKLWARVKPLYAYALQSFSFMQRRGKYSQATQYRG